MWIGYTDHAAEGNYVDSMGNGIQINAWGRGQPDNHIKNVCGKLQKQHCATINYPRRSDWDDDWCCRKRAAVCQTKRITIGSMIIISL